MTQVEPVDVTARHLRGSVLLSGGRVLTILLNFGAQLLTIRYLPKADYGTLAFALSVATVASVVSVFAMDKAASRFLPVYLQDRDYKRFWGMMVLLFSTVVALGVLLIGMFSLAYLFGWPLLASDPRTRLVLVIVSGSALFDALAALFVSLFAVLSRPSAIFFRRHLLEPLLRIAVALVVIAAGGGVYAFAVGQLLAGALSLAICVLTLYGIVRANDELRKAFSQRLQFPFGQLYRYSATLLSGDLAFLLRGAMVPLVLGLLFAKEEVATYQAVMPLARLNEFVLMTFSILFLPSAAMLSAAGNHEQLQRLFEKTTLWVTVLSYPIFAVSFLAADLLPMLLYGRPYQSSGAILAWLALAFYVNASFGTSLRLLRASSRLRTMIAADLLLIGVAVALVAWLVPRYGALGGAWAVCGTYALQALLYHTLVARTMSVNPFAPGSILPFAVGLGLCLLSLGLRQFLGLGPAYAMGAAVICSLVVLLLFSRRLNIGGMFPELGNLRRQWVGLL